MYVICIYYIYCMCGFYNSCVNSCCLCLCLYLCLCLHRQLFIVPCKETYLSFLKITVHSSGVCVSACLFMSVYMCLSVSVRVFVYRDYFIELLKCVRVFAYLFSVRLSAWRSTLFICLWMCVYMFEYCNINYRSICVCFQSCHCIETCICVSINLCFNGNFNINANFRSRHSSICSNH